MGKSTLMKALEVPLREMCPGREVIFTREPGGTPFADEVRGLFRRLPGGEKLNPGVEALLVNAARKDHVDQVIRPALERGAVVVCDRFADSTRVYQGHLGGVDRSVLESLLSFATGQLQPDLTLLLDLPAETMRDRVGQRDQDQDRYDGGDLNMYQAMRTGYLNLADEFAVRFAVVEASASPDEVLKACLSHCHRILKKGHKE